MYLHTQYMAYYTVYICLLTALPSLLFSALLQRLKIVLLIFNRFNIFYSLEIFWFCLRLSDFIIGYIMFFYSL